MIRIASDASELRWLRRLLAAATAMLLVQWSIDAGASSTFPVPLSITEDAGIDRYDEPVTWGVPLPESAAITDPSVLRLVEVGSGDAVPVQWTVTARWQGSPNDATRPIRWVLADFQATLGANETREYRVETGTPAETADPLPVVETATGFEVDTGSAVFGVRKDSINFLDFARLDLDDDGTAETEVLSPGHAGGIEMTAAGKAPYDSNDDDPATQVVLQGPMRTVIRSSGQLTTGMDNALIPDQISHLEYTAYYSFYRGLDQVRVQLAIRYPERNREHDQHDGGRELYQEFDALNVRLPMNLGSDRVVRIVGQGDTVWEGTLGSGETARIYQDSSGGDHWAPPAGGEEHPYLATTFRGFEIYSGVGPVPDTVVATGNQALGFGDVHDGSIGVMAGIRDFWQNCPKGLRLQHDGQIVYELFPSHYRVPHRFRGGIQKTHDLFLAFHEETGDSARARALREGFANPLRLVAPNWVYRDSGAIGRFATEDRELFRHYEEAAEGVIEYAGGVGTQGDIATERFADDLFGWMSWGDTFRAGFKGMGSRYYGNNELDLSFCMLLAYLRDAEHDPRFFENGRAMARHLYDIDLYHTDRDLFWANRGIRKHDASGVQDHSRAPNLSHHWLQGMKVFYWLTGDPFARSFLQDAGSWLHGLEQPPGSGSIEFSGEIRSKGWLLNSFVDLWEFNGDRDHLDLAERMIPAILVPVIQEGGYIVNSDVLVTPWQMSYITEGLGKYLLTRRALGEEDPVALDALTRMLGFLETDAWVPEWNRVCYYWDPIEQVPLEYPSNISQTSADGFVYGYLLTGRADYLTLSSLCYDSVHATEAYPYYYSNTLSTPAKNAGFRLRFGQTEMWLRQATADDIVAPTVEGLRTTDVGSHEARFAFATDEQTARVLFFWADGEPMRWRKNLNYYLHDHEIYVAGLTPDTDYSAAVMTLDLAGNTGWSEVLEFRTPSASLAPPTPMRGMGGPVTSGPPTPEEGEGEEEE